MINSIYTLNYRGMFIMLNSVIGYVLSCQQLSKRKIRHPKIVVLYHFNQVNTFKIMIKFHFQRFEFVLLQLWLILLSFLVCFGSNQCPLTIPECNAMFALQKSFNLSTSITNNGYNQTNPCSKKKQTSKQNKTNLSFFI